MVIEKINSDMDGTIVTLSNGKEFDLNNSTIISRDEYKKLLSLQIEHSEKVIKDWLEEKKLLEDKINVGIHELEYFRNVYMQL